MYSVRLNRELLNAFWAICHVDFIQEKKNFNHKLLKVEVVQYS